MTRQILLAIFLIANSMILSAQTSEKAKNRALSWFTNSRDTIYAMLADTSLGTDIKIWDSTMKKTVGSIDATDRVFSILKFNLLWDKNNKYLPIGQGSAKYIKRLEQIPIKLIEEWQTLSGLGKISDAAISIVAEKEIFPNEKFSELLFKTFINKFKY